MTTFIVDKDGNQASASGLTVPSTRHFREAWSLNGNVITEDLTTAKEIFKDKIREVRKPLLETLDVTYMKSLETGNESHKAEAVKIRDTSALKDGLPETEVWTLSYQSGQIASSALLYHHTDTDLSVWEALETRANLTYVPATETSRQKGAGAGLVDND